MAGVASLPAGLPVPPDAGPWTEPLAQWRVGGTTVGLDLPLVVLAAVPLVAVVAWLVLRHRPGAPTDRRSRYAMAATRVVVVCCLVLAAAGPYTVERTTAVADPRVTMLVDESESMAVYDTEIEDLAAAIEAAGVPVRRQVVGQGNDSEVGEGIVSTVSADGNVLLVSDGRVTAGRSLDAAGEFARGVNATVSSVELGTPATERSVRQAGPPKTTAGVPVAFRVTVDGVEATGPVAVTVTVDGETVATETVDGTGGITVEHTFEQPGVHRVVARIDSDDRVDANDVSYRTVGVVDPPPILYVTRGEYPLGGLLADLYDVRTATSVPSNLDPYAAVVLQDLPAEVGDVDALRSFVADGNGLVVVGGANAFENGGYAESPLTTLLPVQSGEATAGGTAVVLTIDVSGSAAEGMATQKALALDVLDQLDPEDRVGIVAFDTRAYLVAEPQPLGANRGLLEDRIRRLVSGGGTSIAAGLDGARQVLGDAGGNVILLTDGLDESSSVLRAARRLADAGTRVITVGVGPQVDERLLEQVAETTGGSYLRASQASRLRLLFGDAPRSPTGTLAVVDRSHFITAGVEPTAVLPETHDVSVKRGADFLVAAGDGRPALAAWRFGLGRVVTVTAYAEDGTLGGLLARPDSVLLSRSVNWAVGDPERTGTGLVSLPDTRLGESTTAVYAGDERPVGTDLRFNQVAPGRYEATVVPTRQGFETVLGRPYAVDYPVEVAAFGESPALAAVVETTGGRRFGPDQAADIASFVRRRATVVQDVRTDLAWPLVVLAMIVFLVDVAARRLQVYGPAAPTGE